MTGSILRFALLLAIRQLTDPASVPIGTSIQDLAADFAAFA